ncbi:hypothetical protein GCM10023093_18900 [Nemorincola caseinilytica]|uniref:Glycosyltransferase RgtA/B/C/D-like domain-containing protein n=1 Tax=Nemorincola caseinilytica TaxID=2054315 RepID=A0ABP8NE96_9BACT
MRQLLFLFCVLEVLFVTWLIGTLGPYASPLVLFGLSIGIAILFLKIATNAGEVRPAPKVLLPPRVLVIVQWVLFFALSYHIFASLKHIWWYEITYHEGRNGGSDVIPQITALVQRFLRGEQPYYAIQFAEYTLYPTYLPLQWLPYIPLELAHKDYRWVPTFAMWGAGLWFFLRNRKTGAGLLWDLLVPIWPLVLWAVFIPHDNRMFLFSVEGLIAAYYFFVAESLRWQRVWAIALSVAVCLLSRYSIVFWVPLCLLLHFVAGKRRDVLIIAITAIVFFVMLYWLPFLRRDASIFINGYTYHTNAARDEWLRDMATHQGQVYLNNGLGFTSFAIRLLPGDVGHALLLYKNVHIAMCILTVLVLALVYMRRTHSYPLYPYLLFSFKVYLAVFYAFIQIPYKYLFFVPVVVSVALLGGAFGSGRVKEKQTFIA